MTTHSSVPRVPPSVTPHREIGSIRALAAAALVVVAAVILVLIAGLPYALAEEYGASAGSVLSGGLVGAVLAGLAALIVAAALRVVRAPIPAGPALALVPLAGFIVAAGSAIVGDAAHGAALERARTACSATDRASLAEVSLPGLAEGPEGQRDGACRRSFALIPGGAHGQRRAVTLADATLRGLGWQLVGSSGERPLYGRSGAQLELGVEADPKAVTVALLIR